MDKGYSGPPPPFSETMVSTITGCTATQPVNLTHNEYRDNQLSFYLKGCRKSFYTSTNRIEESIQYSRRIWLEIVQWPALTAAEAMSTKISYAHIL